LVTADGRVGIGTTSPSGTYKLYVDGNTYISGVTITNGTLAFGGNLDMKGFDIINTTNIGIGTSDPGTASLAVMNGNVGIGTTGPTYLLDINSTGSAFRAGQITISSNNEIENSSNGVYLQYNTGQPVQVGSATNSSLNIYGSAYIKEDSDRLYLGAGNDLSLYHDGTNSIINNATGYLDIQSAGNTVFSSGNVGIGTASPSEKLEVGDSGKKSFEVRPGTNYVSLLVDGVEVARIRDN
jgi:hypothetical protein